MSIGEDRRRHRRSEVKWPVAVLTPHTRFEGQTENASVGGAFISFAGEPPLEWDLGLIMKPVGQPTVNAVAKVIWWTALATDEGRPRVGVGVEFTRISHLGVLTLGKRCPKCKSRGRSRIHRSWWMRLLPGSKHYVCSMCGSRFLYVSWLFSLLVGGGSNRQ
jgi:hypothetical protein